MDKSRPATERVRPILQAMERSIDAARRRRLNHGDAASPVHGVSEIPRQEEQLPTNENTGRLKARPKRVSPFPAYDDESQVRSRAG